MCSLNFQKARLARIRMAKNASGAAFISSKKRHEERMAARAAGVDVPLKDEDVFEVQHHHLLNCLEKTTVSISIITAPLHSQYTSHFSPLNTQHNSESAYITQHTSTCTQNIIFITSLSILSVHVYHIPFLSQYYQIPVHSQYISLRKAGFYNLLFLRHHICNENVCVGPRNAQALLHHVKVLEVRDMCTTRTLDMLYIFRFP